MKAIIKNIPEISSYEYEPSTLLRYVGKLIDFEKVVAYTIDPIYSTVIEKKRFFIPESFLIFPKFKLGDYVLVDEKCVCRVIDVNLTKQNELGYLVTRHCDIGTINVKIKESEIELCQKEPMKTEKDFEKIGTVTGHNIYIDANLNKDEKSRLIKHLSQAINCKYNDNYPKYGKQGKIYVMPCGKSFLLDKVSFIGDIIQSHKYTISSTSSGCTATLSNDKNFSLDIVIDSLKMTFTHDDKEQLETVRQELIQLIRK